MAPKRFFFFKFVLQVVQSFRFSNYRLFIWNQIFLPKDSTSATMDSNRLESKFLSSKAKLQRFVRRTDYDHLGKYEG